jgi:radical SAM protein with 4Fe4S-binding SPASM domain
MIDITKLYCEAATLADGLRYGEDLLKTSNSYLARKSAAERKPVVVWNITRRCNLKCLHCYSNSENKIYPGELSKEDIYKTLDNLADFNIPALLLSGGEPLMRKDFFDIARYANEKNIRIVLSTNGTLITKDIARKIKKNNFSYVGISLDGVGLINDKFRGQEGSFELTMKAFKNLKELDQRVGLRMTLTRHNISDLENIFDFIEKEEIDRACFYHLAYAGRGDQSFDISHEDSRKALDIILKRTKDFYDRGLNINILTVDNHVDGVYTYLKLLEEDPEKAERTYEKLLWNGGGNFSSGVGIGAIDAEGNVHPDQFWRHYSPGNVKDRPFSTIWQDTSDPIMAGLKDRQKLLKGKCSRCKWLNICGGSLRVRADRYFNDPWMEDPACYLTKEEIN